MYFLSPVSIQMPEKATPPDSWLVNSPKKATGRSHKNLSKRGMSAIPKTSTCTAASWASPLPLTEDLLTIDYIVQKKYPLIFVTSGKLGSINHTLLSFEAIRHRGIRLDTVMYNLYPTVADKTIQEDTLIFIRKQMEKYFPDAQFILVPEI